MAAIHKTTRFLGRIPFGSEPPKVLRGFPSGKIKVKLRNDDFPRVYVRNEQGIQSFYPMAFGEAWEPAILIAQNFRP